MSASAPLFHDLAGGPPGGRAFWLRAADGVRLRAAHWPGGAKGTVLFFPGRTEYIEKYGRAAADLALRGYGTLCLDWRGQGLSERALPDPMMGHVSDFAEYQLDVQALVGLADALDLPGSRYLLSHSMGGAIGLRALLDGLKVQAAAFSSPMWGIAMTDWMRPVAATLATLSHALHLDHRYAPGTTRETYVTSVPFAGNVLTAEPEMFAMMQAHARAHPELTLGGPSLGWLHAALVECRDLAVAPSPDLAALTTLGQAEKVVDPVPIHRRMTRWSKGRLELYAGAEHEMMMETRARRQRFFDSVAALFDTHR